MSSQVRVTIDFSRDRVHLTTQKNNTSECDVTLELYHRLLQIYAQIMYHKSNQLASHATVIDQDVPVLIAAESAENNF